MCDIRSLLEIRHVHFGISDGLEVDETGFFVDGIFKRRRIGGFDRNGLDAVFFKDIFKQQICGHEQRVSGHQLIPCPQQGHTGIADGSHAGCHDHGASTAVQFGQLLFQHPVGGVGQAHVDMIRGLSSKSPAEIVCGFMKMGSGLIYGRKRCPLPVRR